jgi:hypothetical protein
MATLGDYIRHLQEKLKQPNESNQPNQSCKYCYGIGYDASGQSCECTDNPNFQHPCPNNPILTCNCGDPKFCAELGNDPDNQHRDPADTDHDGFSDNLDYTGIPIPTKGQSKVSGWPCVVVGAVCETWTTTSERILRTTASEWDTEQHTDAGLDNDGPAATTKL